MMQTKTVQGVILTQQSSLIHYKTIEFKGGAISNVKSGTQSSYSSLDKEGYQIVEEQHGSSDEERGKDEVLQTSNIHSPCQSQCNISGDTKRKYNLLSINL